MEGLVEMRNKENINTISLEHLKELRKNMKILSLTYKVFTLLT